MYESWFGLSERPFSLAPQLDEYFPANGIESARTTLKRCVDRGVGPGVVIGGSGTGKTILCHALANEFRSKMPLVVVEATGITSWQAFLQWILFGMGREYKQMSDGELRLTLTDYLISSDTYQNGLVLIVDDAHGFPTEVWDEVVALSNLVREGNWCVHLVLAGKPQLEEILSVSRMESFNQKIAARYYLHPLSRKETVAYVQHHVEQAGGQLAELFTTEALEQLHETCSGIPRLINQICDHVFLLAAVGQVPRISATAIQEAWADLQQLPVPVQLATQSSAVIEFGSLPPEAPQTSAAETETYLSTVSEPIASEPMEIEGEEIELEHIIARHSQPVADETTGGSGSLSHSSEIESMFEIADPVSPETERIESAEFDDSLASALPPLTSISNNPFLESFEEEEFVVDDLGTLQNEVVSHYASLKTAQSQQLSNYLENVKPDQWVPDADAASDETNTEEYAAEIRVDQTEIVTAEIRADLATDIAAELISQIPTDLAAEGRDIHGDHDDLHGGGDLLADGDLHGDAMAIETPFTIEPGVGPSDEPSFIVLIDEPILPNPIVDTRRDVPAEPPSNQEKHSRYGQLFSNLHRKHRSSRVKRSA